MDGRLIDRVALGLATGTSRRRALRSLAASAFGIGVFGSTLHARRVAALSARLQNAPDDERGILLYELLAATLEGAAKTGDCQSVAEASKKFLTDQASLLSELEAEESEWSDEERRANHTRYADRKQAAGKSIIFALHGCSFQPNSQSLLCMAESGPIGTPVAIQEGTAPGAGALQLSWAAQTACSGCDCNCICPISWSDCIGYSGGCAGGSRSSCCWAAMCVNCETTCNSSQCCSHLG